MSTPRNRLILSLEADLERLPNEGLLNPGAQSRRRHYPYAHSDGVVGRERPMRVKDFEIAVGEAQTRNSWAVFRNTSAIRTCSAWFTCTCHRSEPLTARTLACGPRASRRGW